MDTQTDRYDDKKHERDRDTEKEGRQREAGKRQTKRRAQMDTDKCFRYTFKRYGNKNCPGQ